MFFYNLTRSDVVYLKKNNNSINLNTKKKTQNQNNTPPPHQKTPTKTDMYIVHLIISSNQ